MRKLTLLCENWNCNLSFLTPCWQGHCEGSRGQSSTWGWGTRPIAEGESGYCESGCFAEQNPDGFWPSAPRCAQFTAWCGWGSLGSCIFEGQAAASCLLSAWVTFLFWQVSQTKFKVPSKKVPGDCFFSGWSRPGISKARPKVCDEVDGGELQVHFSARQRRPQYSSWIFQVQVSFGQWRRWWHNVFWLKRAVVSKRYMGPFELTMYFKKKIWMNQSTDSGSLEVHSRFGGRHYLPSRCHILQQVPGRIGDSFALRWALLGACANACTAEQHQGKNALEASKGHWRCPEQQRVGSEPPRQLEFCETIRQSWKWQTWRLAACSCCCCWLWPFAVVRSDRDRASDTDQGERDAGFWWDDRSWPNSTCGAVSCRSKSDLWLADFLKQYIIILCIFSWLSFLTV